MEITLEQIQAAIATNPSLIDGLIKPILESDKGKTVLTAEANLLYKANIDTEIGKVHNLYDEQIFKRLGVRPGTGADGKKEKTYDFLDKHLENLERLTKIETQLNENDVIKKLKTDNETLLLKGGGDHWKGVHDQSVLKWEQERKQLEERATKAEGNITTGAVALEIAKAKAGIQFNPDVKENIRNIVLQNIENELLATAKVGDDGKVFFVDKDGKTRVNDKYETMSALDALMAAPEMADITLKTATKGGGAPPTTATSIATTTVEGKDVKKLVLPAGSFTTKIGFITEAEKGLIAAGITMRDPDWDKLKNAAYVEYEVAKLPAE